MGIKSWLWVVLGCLLIGCRQAQAVATITPRVDLVAAIANEIEPTATSVPTTSPPTATETLTPTVTATLVPSPTITVAPAARCGQLLPVVVTEPDRDFEWQVPFLSDELIPEDVMPAIEYLFEHPNDVSLVVYRLGYEGIGFYHQADRPMPLASVSKLVQLVAYGDAVEVGLLDPDQPVPLEDLEQFYLPRSDLGAHTRALRELDEDNVSLKDVVWMTMRYSANSSADYLHHLLGQTLIEQTIIDLGMEKHSALCPFIGRFLIMGNHTTDRSNNVQTLADDHAAYGSHVIRLTDWYTTDAQFRTAAQSYWSNRQQPSVGTQVAFVQQLETRGTAQGYADLMAAIAQSDNPHIRDPLEWPLAEFESNQANYATIGYKNGTLPSVLTTVYYAEPFWADQPIVVALFYKDLPNNVYQRWRRTFPHDAFAHWLMNNPNAIHIMHVLRDNAAE